MASAGPWPLRSGPGPECTRSGPPAGGRTPLLLAINPAPSTWTALRPGLPGQRRLGERGRQELRCEPAHGTGCEGRDLRGAATTACLTGTAKLVTLPIAAYAIGSARRDCRIGRTGGLVTRRTGIGYLPAPDSPSLPAPGHSCLPDASPPGCSRSRGRKREGPVVPVTCPGAGGFVHSKPRGQIARVYPLTPPPEGSVNIEPSPRTA